MYKLVRALISPIYNYMRWELNLDSDTHDIIHKLVPRMVQLFALSTHAMWKSMDAKSVEVVIELHAATKIIVDNVML